MRLFLVAAAISLVITFIYFVLYSVLKYMRMIGNIFLSLVYKPPVEVALPARGERVTILASNDQEIEVLFLEKKYSKKAVIFCHESGSSKESWERYAYFVPNLGFHVLSVDFTAREQEGRKTPQNPLSQWPTREGMRRLLTVVRWAKRALHADMRIVLFGVSNGADIALAASFEEPSVVGVVADGLFSMKEIFRDYIRRWAPILVKPNLFGQDYPSCVVNFFARIGFWYSQRQSKKDFIDVEGLLSRRHKPLLMIHGERDDYVPERHQRFLEKVNRDGVSFKRLVVPGAGHNQAVLADREVYEENVTDFLTRIC